MTGLGGHAAEASRSSRHVPTNDSMNSISSTSAGIAALAILGLLSAGPVSTQTSGTAGPQGDAPPVRFRTHVVAQQIASGYQVIAVDMNKDHRLDLIGLGTARQVDLNWYESPSWTPHLIAADLPNKINAAAHDIEGDGLPELAIQHGFSTANKTSVGSISLLSHASANEPWTRRDIDALPTSHRIRWMKVNGGRTVLVNAPLLGQDAATTDAHAPNQLVFYEGPGWKRQVLGEVDGLVHGIQATGQAPFGNGDGESLLSAGFTGIVQHQLRGGKWASTSLAGGSPTEWPKSGSSDVAVGVHGGVPIIATLEPWHGNQVVVYRHERESWVRQVLDETLTDAHALATGDFDGSGRSAIVAGERQGQRSVYVYWPPATLGEPWRKQVLDGTLNASACIVVDLNADGRIDIACIGNQQPSLKWYENLGR